MSKIKIDVDLDRASERMLQKALKRLNYATGKRAIIKAQKDAMKPIKDRVYSLAKSELNTKSLKRTTVQTVTGKYAKKLRPYVVVQFADRAIPTTREREFYSSKTETNWFKINHLVTMGTKAGNRRAGRRTREAQSGRNRIKDVDSQGRSTSTQISATSGRYFLVSGPKGLHPIKMIAHPGIEHGSYFDRAVASDGAPVYRTFTTHAKNRIEQEAKKHGLK